MGCKKISYHEKKISPLKVIWSEAHTNKARQENKKNTEFFDVDYYAFGMQMPGRNYTSASGYRYGFNGQEKDDEVSGNGNSYTAEFWQYDPRLGRRWNIDPVVKPWESPYAAFSDNPILKNDPAGNDPAEVVSGNITPNPYENQKEIKIPGGGYQSIGGSFPDPLPKSPERKSVKDLSISEKGKNFIKSYEQGPNGGAALAQYDDANPKGKATDVVKGFLTIGYGHKVLAGEDYSKGITQTQADDLLNTDIQSKAVNSINKLVKAPVSQQEFDALVSYVFNTGSLAGTTLLKNLNSKDYSGAVKEMDINTSNGEYMQGLENRRKAEHNIFNNGIYKNN